MTKLWAYQTVNNNICPNINAQLLKLSRLQYIMRIVPCPLVVVVKMYYAVSTKSCLIRKEHGKRLGTLLNKSQIESSHAGDSVGFRTWTCSKWYKYSNCSRSRRALQAVICVAGNSVIPRLSSAWSRTHSSTSGVRTDLLLRRQKAKS
jgi:hypothetical protein